MMLEPSRRQQLNGVERRLRWENKHAMPSRRRHVRSVVVRGTQRPPSNKSCPKKYHSRLSAARFIKFRDHNNAAKALEELSGAEIQGRTMRLSRASGR